MDLSVLNEVLGGKLEGPPNLEIHGVGSLEKAQAGEIAFYAHARYRKALAMTKASVVILAEKDRGRTALPKIIVEDPYASWAKAVRLFAQEEHFDPGVHETAIIHPEARLGKGVHIGPYCVVGKAVIGEHTRIEAHCVIGDDTKIGSCCLFYPSVVLYPKTEIGHRVIIHSGAVIGADGFGFALVEGRWLKVPQMGRVCIGHDVEIGANTTIDRAALDETRIEDGVKIDNLVQIAHNVRIGAHSAVAGCAAIAGSTTIGRSVLLGGATMVNGHIDIGDGAIVSGATTIMRSVPGKERYTTVPPAMTHEEWRKNTPYIERLMEMARRLAEVEKALALERQKT